MISVNQLFHFIHVVQTGSISKAAENLFVAQPAISKSIKRIETELQIKLFELDKKRLKLTNDGENIYKIATEIVSSYQKLEQYGKEDSVLSHINYYASPIIHELITPNLNIFELFPKVQFSIYSLDSFADFIDLFEYPQSDMLGIFLLPEKELDRLTLPEDFRLEIIATRQFQIIASYKNQNPLLKKEFLYLEDVASLPFVHYNGVQPSMELLYKGVFKNIFAIMPTYTMLNETLHRHPETIAIGNNLFFPQINQRLISVPIKDLPTVSLTVLYKKNEHNKLYQRLISHLKNLYT